MILKDFTLADVYRRDAQLFPDRTAFVLKGKRIATALLASPAPAR